MPPSRGTGHDPRWRGVHPRGIEDPATATALGEAAYRRLREDIDLLAATGARRDLPGYLAGTTTPAMFGGALTGFGVASLLDMLCALAPPLGPRVGDRGPVRPDSPRFSGFVFQVQANIDPRHHDRMAFLRVCSGRFRRGMIAHHARLGRPIRLTRPHRLFAREREPVEEADPGDIVGLSSSGLLALGGTLCEGEPFRFAAIPRFPLENRGGALRPRRVPGPVAPDRRRVPADPGRGNRPLAVPYTVGPSPRCARLYGHDDGRRPALCVGLAAKARSRTGHLFRGWRMRFALG